MSDKRAFIFAHAGILFGLILALVSSGFEGHFAPLIWTCIALGLPPTVFRGLISGHKDNLQYKAISGVALCFSIPGTIGAYGFLFASYSKQAGVIFLLLSLFFFLMLRYGKRSKAGMIETFKPSDDL
jgi:uncharacterized membrane protein YagU involved in acid resistance